MSKYDFNYFLDRADREIWGEVHEDDKYYPDEDLMDSFACFTVYCYAHLNLPSPTKNQIYMSEFISDRNFPNRMCMAMRGLAKSLTSQIYTVWRLLNDPNEHILVMSATGRRAENFTSFCKKLLRTLPITQSMAPRHNIERTSGNSFDVVGSMISDSPNVYAIGVEHQIAGFRATIVIYDDIETAQTAISAVRRESIDHFAKEAINLLMAGKDETITLCTPHSRDSMYMEWITQGHEPFLIPAEYPTKADYYGSMLAPHLVEDMKKNPNLAGKPTDARYTRSVLQGKELTLGKSAYRLQFLLDTSESDSLKYPLKLSDLIVTNIDIDTAPETIKYSSMPTEMLYLKHNGFKEDRLFRPSFSSEETRPYGHRVMAIDPSGRGQDEVGYAVGFTLGGKLWTKEVGGIEGGYDAKTVGQLLKIASEFKVDTIVLESNFGDGMFASILEASIDSLKLNIRLEEVRVKNQKEVRIIETLEPLMNQHRIIVDKDFIERDKQKKAIYSFTYQLSHLTSERGSLKHDDEVDALSLLCIYLTESFNVIDGYVEEIDNDKMTEDFFFGLEDFNPSVQNQESFSNQYF